MKNLKRYSFILFFALCHSVENYLMASEEDERPNFIIIMADDLGFSDLGCYGGEIETPNIDQLAKDGIRFTQFYNASRCCPTRASLMSGFYPHEVGLRYNGRSLSREIPTIAERLKDCGYQTGMTGKWHLSETEPLNGGELTGENHQRWVNNRERSPPKYFADRSTYPTARGFDSFYGVIWGVVNFFNPFSLVEGFEGIHQVSDGYYFTDAVNSKSAEYIREFSKQEEPFFLYIAHAAPHWPLHAKAEDIEKYKGRFDQGWEALRHSRYQKLQELGLITESESPLPSHNRGEQSGWGILPVWDQLTDEQRKLEARRMEVHAAMIDSMDQGLEEVFDALKETGEWENTVIFVLSDNGASPEQVKKPGYDRPSLTKDGEEILYHSKIRVQHSGHEIAFDGIGPAWANTCNTPYRYWKKESYEGGHHTPMILHWPAGLNGEEGTISERLSHVFDIPGTMLALANSEGGVPIRGSSLLDADTLKVNDGHDILYFEHEGGASLITQKWKLARLTPEHKWELFNRVNDRTETTDVAESFPEKVEELSILWNRWFSEVCETGNVNLDIKTN